MSQAFSAHVSQCASAQVKLTRHYRHFDRHFDRHLVEGAFLEKLA